MTDTLPTHEPGQFRKGDTVKWTKAAIAYGVQRKPGDGWTLTYTFSTLNFSATVTSTTDDGGSFAVTIADTVSAGWSAGAYAWQAKVSDGSETFTVDQGATDVLADFIEDDGRGHEARSFAQRTLDALEAVLARKATRDQLTYSIGDRALSRMSWEELLTARDRFRIEVASEVRAQRAATGQSSNQHIRAVF